MESETWLLLLYELPVKRNTARVNLWRKLKRFGAVQLKTSAYVLPDDSVQYERFQWLSQEIRDAGGEATLIRVAEINGMTDQQVVQLFNEARARDYKKLVIEVRKKMKERMRRDGELHGAWEKFNRRFDEIGEVDYFESPSASDAQMALQQIKRLAEARESPASAPKLQAKEFKGRTWVTRPRPGIDRCGSAWLIREFIDITARFVFATEPAKFSRAVPFDMADVEFSHHGEDCTFETLVKRFGISDKAVLKIAEMVHDADLEDGKFQRTECIGVNCVLAGWKKSGIKDAELLEKGIECFEGLYQAVKK